MSAINPLDYFILLEGSVVALLATALAKQGSTQPSRSQLKFWDGFAQLCQLPLSSAGPQSVEVEKYRMDLLTVWDNWAIMIEVKMKKEHVREKQLQRYYDKLRTLLGTKGTLANASSIAVVFLTPANVGGEEFSSLSVDGNDKKQHLKWKEVLSLIGSSFSKPQASPLEEEEAFRHSLISFGVKRIGKLLNLGDS